MADYLLPYLRLLLSDIEAIERSIALRRNEAIRAGAENAAQWEQCHMDAWYAARQLRDIIYIRQRENEDGRSRRDD